MRTRLWLVLLAAGAWAAGAAGPPGALAELLALLERARSAVAAGTHSWRIETPLHLDSANCVNKMFEGTELLKKQLDMKKFGVFFQKFERLKQSLTLHPGEEEECDTERKNPIFFIDKLATFIRKSSQAARAPSS